MKRSQQKPFESIREPELIKYNPSQRITIEHRLVYKVVDDNFLIA